MYVTMDNDFNEDLYFYHHLRCPGENKTKDDLSWLTVNMDHTEQVDNAIEIVSEAIVQPSLTSKPHPISVSHLCPMIPRR